MNISTQGETRRLDCQVIGWPVPDIIWLKDDVDITRDPRYRYTFDGEAGLVSLFIDGIQPGDSGWYSCVALNDHGAMVVRSLLVVRGPDGSLGSFSEHSPLDDAQVIEIAKQRRLSYMARSSSGDDAPRFLNKPDSRTIRYIGDPLRLDCEIAGSPTPTITWLKDGKALSAGGEGYRFESDNARRRLVIDSLSASDGGAYSVRLENTAGVTQHDFSLQVRRREKPQFDDSSANTFEVTEGDHIVITFQLSGQPPPQLNWVKDGKVFSANGQRVKVGSDEHRQEVSFELAYAERSDAGHYECMAENSEGRTHRKFELIVKGTGVQFYRLNDKEFVLAADSQLPDARSGDAQAGVAFAKGTVFTVEDGQSPRNWLVSELASAEKTETAPAFFVSPGLVIPVARKARRRLLSSTDKDDDNDAKRKNLISCFCETVHEFIEELSGLPGINTTEIVAVHKNMAEMLPKSPNDNRQFEDVFDTLLGDFFQSVLNQKIPDQEELALSRFRCQGLSRKTCILSVVTEQLEYYVSFLQELSLLNPERSKQNLAAIDRIISFEKSLCSQGFMAALESANERGVMTDVLESGRFVRLDAAVVKGPQGWKCDDAEVAFFDRSLHIITKPSKVSKPVDKSLKLCEYRLTECSERGMFVNLQHPTGGRWRFILRGVPAYLCFLKELNDSGCLRVITSSTSVVSILSASSDELFTCPSGVTSADEYLTAHEESYPVSEHVSDDETLINGTDTRATVTPEPAFKPCFTCDAKQLNMVEGNASQVALSFVAQPRPTILWMTADRQPLKVKGLAATEDGNLAVLKITDARVDMTGTYICQVTNASGTAEMAVAVAVKPNAELRRPHFVKQLSDTSVSEDGALSLMTEYSSMEKVTNVEWLLNGETITTSKVKTVKVMTTEQKSTLSIDKVEKNFSGAVSCVVSNEFGQATSTCGVSVRPGVNKSTDDISITSSIKKAQIKQGEDFLWPCDVKAPEPFGVTWSKVGEVCSSEALSRISLETIGSDCVLFRIKKVHVSDAGTYRCTLTYQEQSSSCEVVLGITELDEPPEITETPIIDRLAYNAIGLSWPKIVYKEETITYTVEQTYSESGEWTVSRSKVVETHCQIDDLMPNCEYWFRVFAEDSRGRRGKPSPAVGYLTGEEVTVPEKPTNAKMTQISPNHWVMSWEAPRAPGAEELSYMVEVFDARQSTWRKLASGIQKTKIDMKQLKSDQIYLFRVRAVNSAGTSEPSDEATKPVETLTEEVPAPAKLMLVELSPTLVWLIWQPPPQADGLVYVIEAQDIASGEWCRLGEHGVTETRIELNNLLEDEEYKFRVRSFQESTSRLSEPSNEVCRPAKWNEQLAESTEHEITEETTLDQVRDIAAGVIEQEVVTIKQERVEIVQDESSKIVTEEIVEETVIEEAVVAEPVPPPVPATPANSKITYKADNVACLEWQSGQAGGVIPEDVTFLVETKVKADQWTTIVQNIKATNIDLKGLKMDRDYFFRIRAKGNNGTSEPSEPVRCRLSSEQKQPQPAPTPQQMKIENVGPKTVKVSWAMASEAEEVTGYEIEMLDKNAEKPTWKKVGQAKGKADNTFTVEELDAAHEYEFRVAALNEAGSGMPTKPIVRKAQVAPQHSVEQLSLEKVDSKKSKLSWQGTAEAQSYVVEMRDKSGKSGEWKKVASDVSQTFVSIEVADPTHEYELRVVGVNEFGAGMPSQSITRQAVLPPQKPPTELNLEEIDAKSVKLTWNRVEDATSYRVEMIDRGTKKPEWKKLTDEFTEPQAVVKELEPSHDYELRVAAVSDTGVGVPSQPVTRQGKKPPQQAPGDFKLDQVDSKTAKVSWSPLEGVKSYVVEVLDKSQKNPAWKKVSDSSELFATVDLDPARQYELRVAGINEIGVGVASQPIVRKARTAPQKAPTEISLEIINPETANIKWTAMKPEDDVSGYVIEAKSPTEKEWHQFGEVSGIETSMFEATKLKGDRAYEFHVVPTNEIGKGTPSKTALRAVQLPPQSPPGDVTVTNMAECTKAKVEWKKVPEANKGYSVQLQEKDGEMKESARLVEGVLTAEIANLDAFTEYSIQVAGVNDLGVGVNSQPIVREARQVTLTAPEGLKIAQTGELSCRLSWSPVEVIKDLRYQVEQNSGSKWQILADKHQECKFEVTDLKPGLDYRFLVRAKASYGAGPPSNEVTFPVTPAKVKNAVFSQIGENKGQLAWSFEETAEDAANKSTFCIEVTTGTSGKFREVMKDVTETKVELTGLKVEQDYVFRVRAKNPYGVHGDYSAEAHGCLSGVPPGADCKLENVTAKEVDDESDKVIIAWSKLKPSVAENVTGFTIEMSEAGSDKWSKVGSISEPEACKLEVASGIDRAKDISFRVTPVNKHGSGPASNSALLPKRKPKAPKVAPAEVKVTSGGDEKSATVSWKALPQLLGCCYSVERRENSKDDWETVVSDVADSKVDVTELQPASAYSFRVFANNEAGRGPPSPEVVLASRVKPPSQVPVGLTVKAVNSSKALLEWTSPEPAYTTAVESRIVPSGTFKPLASGIEGTQYEASALKPDSEYAFRCCLQNKAGQMGKPSAEVLLGKRTKPDTIRSAPALKELQSPKGSYELSWSELPTVSGLEPPRYIIERASSELPSMSTWVPLETSSPIYKSPFTLTDLKPEHEYRFRIITENAYGRSEPSLDVNRRRKFQPVAPNRITSRPLIDNDTGTSCRLSWVPVSSVDDSEPIRYQIERAGEGSKQWEVLAKDHDAKEYQITDIKPEDYWRFRIRACNRFGESEPSTEVIRDRLVDPVPPKRPRLAPNLLDLDDVSCQLSWPASSAQGNDTVTYTVERLSGSDAWTPLVSDITEVSYTARDLNPEDEYWFRVKCRNRYGLSEPSPHAIRYRKYDAKPPKTISGTPTLTDLTDTAVRLSWTPCRGPGPETLYIIEVADSNTSGHWRTLPIEISESSYDITDLPPQFDYRFRIRSKNKFGTSEASREAYRPRRYDSGAFKVPGQPQIQDLDDTSCRLSWRPLEIPDILYRIESLDETQKDWSTIADRLVEPPHVIHDLKPDLDYRFRVRGFSDRYGILGDYSSEVTRYGPYSSSNKRPPRAPAGVPTLTEIDDVNYRLSWTASREHGVRYAVEQFDSDRFEWFRVIDDNPDPWYDLRGLKTDLDYRFRIRATNRYGTSEPTLEALRPKRINDKAPPGPIPGIPTLLDLTDSSCRLMWQPVYGNKSSLIYIVETLDHECWIEVASDITLTSYDVKSLDSDREYFFRIRAKNQFGYSEPSTTVRRSANVVKAKEVPPRPVTSLPAILEISDTHIQLSWEPARLPSNAKQTRIFYIIESYDKEIDRWKVVIEDLEDLVVEFDNLDSVKEYTFRVVAKNEFGTSEPSVPATRYKKRTPIRGPPSAPIAPPLVDDLSDVSIRLTWVPPITVSKAPSEFIYIIETRDEITLRWTTLTEQNETSLDVNDLNKDTDYWFRVRVKDVTTGLISSPSPDSCRRKKLPKKAPLILPSRPRITEIDDQTIRLSWSGVSARGIDTLTYIIEMLVVGTEEWTQVAKGLSDNSKVIRDLDANKSYSFRTRVETDFGISDASTEVVLKQRKFGSDKLDIGLPPAAVSGKPVIQDIPGSRLVKLTWRPARSRQRTRYNEEEIIVIYTIQMSLMGYDGGIRALVIEDAITTESSFCTDTWETIATDLTKTEYSLVDFDTTRSYQFRVIASNKYGQSDPSPISSLIRGGDMSLQGGERHSMPELRCDKNVIYGVEGRTAVIEFALTGNPAPEFKWYFNEAPILIDKHPDKYRVEYVENVVSIRIAFMSENDVGYYGCSAWNVRGRASTGVRLAIADPPMFLEPLRDLTMTLYGNGSLECRIDGQPYPEVRWYKDWQLVPQSSRIKIRHWEPHLWTLAVNNSIHRDSGLYIVEAENVAGKIHCVASLKVEETPSQLLNLVFRPSAVEEYYHILEEIDRGSSAVIRRVIEKSTNHEFASKFIRIFDHSLRSSLKSEVETIRGLHHRHIMHIEDAFETRKFLVIVCELITGGLLFEKIIADDTLTERDVAMWVKQLLTVLKHIHDHKVVYLDLQPENIHLCSPKHSAYVNDIKLIDFGWALKMESKTDAVSAHCNPEFSAPEVARSEPVTTAADIWSLGILTYLMLTGESPLWAGNYDDTFKQLKSGELKLESSVLSELSQEACDFISECLHLDPAKRPSAMGLLDHPFIGFAERLGKGTRLSVERLKGYTLRLMKAKQENKLNLTAEVAKRRALSSDKYEDARSRTPSPDRTASAVAPSGGAVDADFWDDWMDQYVCGAAEDVKEKLKYYYYRTGQQPKITEGLGKIGVKEQMDDADWAQLALNLQNRLSRREAERRATDGRQPSFNVCINDGGYEVGRNFMLMARIDGRPTPVVTWYRNDEGLHDGYRVVTHSSPESGHAWLTLLMAKPHDAAVYKCVARNSFGIARCRARVSEGDIPGAPGRPVISEISSTEAFVIWDAPKDSGNIASRYYKVDYRDSKSEKWTCAGYVIDESAYVAGLRPNNIYRFRVSCGNRISLGGYSYGSIEVKTKDTGAPALSSLTEEQREVMLNKRQFPCPPIIDTLRQNRQFFQLLSSTTTVNSTPDFFKVIDPPSQRPLEIQSGDDTVSLVSKEFTIGESLKRQMGMSLSLVTEIQSGRQFLLRTASKTSAVGLKLMQELEILRELESNRIEFVKAAFETQDELSTISLPVNFDLDIVQHLCFKNKYSENDVATVVRQLLDALHYLHKRRIVHSNVNPRSVIISDIMSYSVRLCGFDHAIALPSGASEAIRSSWSTDDTDVDANFCAPELFASSKDTSVSYQTDVWSLAAITFLLLSGETPFAGKLPSKIKEAEWRSDELYENTSKPAFKFLVQTLKANPLHRLTAEEAQEHRWLSLTEEATSERHHVLFSSAKLRSYNSSRN